MATLGSPTQTRAPGRPRSDATNEAIVQAALELLEAETYQNVSIDKIANQARVGKQTIYRRWNSKADLLIDVMADRVFNRSATVVPSGDATNDVAEYFKRAFVQLRHPLANKGFRALVAEAQLDIAFREKFYAIIVNERRFQLREILKTGTETGQFRGDVDLDLATDALLGGFWFRLLSGTGAPLDDKFAVSLVAVVEPYLRKTV